jgi:hypothetical protein
MIVSPAIISQPTFKPQKKNTFFQKTKRKRRKGKKQKPNKKTANKGQVKNIILQYLTPGFLGVGTADIKRSLALL